MIIIKSHNDIFSYFIQHNFTNSLIPPSLLPFIKGRGNLISNITVPLVSFPFPPEFMKGICLIKGIVTSVEFPLNISVDSDKVTAFNTVFFLW